MIDFIFNILNFLLVVGTIIYVFYKYLLKNILKAFQEDKANIQLMLDQDKSLAIFKEKLDKSIEQQDITGKNLTLKIERWQSYIEAEKEKKIDEYNKYYSKVKSRLKIQHNNYQNQIIQDQISPELFDSLEYEFHDYFKDQSNTESYFENIFKNKLKFKD
ncbi:MAG: hypothetical protein M0R03_18715 [Novosphingobium sp.]|nr:hypothetical protein [Novosphingobium sp.]